MSIENTKRKTASNPNIKTIEIKSDEKVSLTNLKMSSPSSGSYSPFYFFN